MRGFILLWLLGSVGLERCSASDPTLALPAKHGPSPNPYLTWLWEPLRKLVHTDIYKEALKNYEQEKGREGEVSKHESNFETHGPVETILEALKYSKQVECREFEAVPENLASSGSATQSSQYNNLAAASNAIDRKRNPVWLDGSCSHTQAETNPWWTVELLDVYNVTSVTITNRVDCCHTRINGAEIRVGNDLNGGNNPLCAVITEIGAGQSMEFVCGGMEGRYVTVVLPGEGKRLTLCEVEVHGDRHPALPAKHGPSPNPYLTWLWEPLRKVVHTDIYKEALKNYEQEKGREGELSKHESNLETHGPVETILEVLKYSKQVECREFEAVPENLASSGSATQSSQYTVTYLGAASKAIDRKRNPAFFDGSCSCTQAETNPWWTVEMLDVYNVTSVTITNRGDCCHTRINGAEIRVGNDLNGGNNPLCAVITEIGAGQSMEFGCRGMEGRYVTVVLPGEGKFLTLCEVEVHGGPLQGAFKYSKQVECREIEMLPENLASSGSATQSSLYDNNNDLAAASNAIDRKRNPVWLDGSCSHTQAETNPWWTVELLHVYNVTSVTITNRADCCHTRINGAEIRVGNDLNGGNNPLCAVITEMREGQSMEFVCGKMEGRYVTVLLPGEGKYLTLCEVEVHGDRHPDHIHLDWFSGVYFFIDTLLSAKTTILQP